MDFHGIDMQGYFKLVGVIDASALSWTPDDEGKIVYDETTENLWIANDSAWVNGTEYVDTPLGTEMWIYANTAPTGWTISATVAGDELLAVKGGSYATGGTVDGDWDTPTHYHGLNNHTHLVSGSTGTATGGTASWRSGGDEVVAYHTHTLSTTSQIPSPTVTSTDGSVSTYRPESRVGLICERT